MAILDAVEPRNRWPLKPPNFRRAEEKPVKKQFVAEHAEFIDELRKFFDDKSRFDQMADPFKPVDDAQPELVGHEATLLTANGEP